MFRSTRKKGDALERRVVRLMQRMGYLSVKRNVFLKDKHGNRSEIDVLARGVFSTRYIECKNFSKAVGLEHIAKFKEVLRLNGVPFSKGIFVTSGRVSPRVHHVGIAVWDGRELRRRERMAFWSYWFRRLMVLVGIGAVGYLWAFPLMYDRVEEVKRLVDADPYAKKALHYSKQINEALDHNELLQSTQKTISKTIRTLTER